MTRSYFILTSVFFDHCRRDFVRVVAIFFAHFGVVITFLEESGVAVNFVRYRFREGGITLRHF